MSFVSPPFSASLLESVLALNNAHAEELSFKTAAQFRELITASHVTLAEPMGLALIVAFSDASAYDNPNFTWLKVRYQRFIYIDRVVVNEAARGQGLARRLYAELEKRVVDEKRERLVCEINLDPPNEASDQFHQALGFSPVGSQMFPGGKTVRYWARELRGELDKVNKP